MRRFIAAGRLHCPGPFHLTHHGLITYRDALFPPPPPPPPQDLVDYIISGPVVSMVWEGKGVVAAGRKLIGATKPADSEPGTIRGDYCVDVGRCELSGINDSWGRRVCVGGGWGRTSLI